MRCTQGRTNVLDVFESLVLGQVRRRQGAWAGGIGRRLDPVPAGAMGREEALCFVMTMVLGRWSPWFYHCLLPAFVPTRHPPALQPANPVLSS